MRLLCRAVEADPELGRCKALRARTTFGPRNGVGQLVKVAARLHMELIDIPVHRSAMTRLHDLGENMLVWALLYTFNPGGLRSAKFMRERHTFWMSRKTLEQAYGAAATVGPEA